MSVDPWYCALVAAPNCTTSPAAVNWQDFGIRAGLIVIGGIVLIIALAKLMSQPQVVIEK